MPSSNNTSPTPASSEPKSSPSWSPLFTSNADAWICTSTNSAVDYWSNFLISGALRRKAESGDHLNLFPLMIPVGRRLPVSDILVLPDWQNSGKVDAPAIAAVLDGLNARRVILIAEDDELMSATLYGEKLRSVTAGKAMELQILRISKDAVLPSENTGN